jgi:hypothetical protein
LEETLEKQVRSEKDYLGFLKITQASFPEEITSKMKTQ